MAPASRPRGRPAASSSLARSGLAPPLPASEAPAGTHPSGIMSNPADGGAAASPPVAHRWSHQELSPRQRELFIAAFRQAEVTDWIFRRVSASAVGICAWPCIIALACLGLTLTAGRPLAATAVATDALLHVLACFSGVVALQLWFVASHTAAHAFMLEYDQHAPGAKRLASFGICRLPIYFYAFYHHHHSASDDWAPFLSYHDPDKRRIWNHAGTRGVIASHWVNYSHLSFLIPDGHLIPATASILALAVYAHVVCSCRYFTPFLCGYELGVLLLPLAHGWQHIPRCRFGPCLRPLLGALESLGLIAGKADHWQHHVHTGAAVYRSFSSSGLYARRLDRWVDAQWARAVHATSSGGTQCAAKGDDRRPFDVLWPQAVAAWVSVWVLPNLGCVTLERALGQ